MIWRDHLRRAAKIGADVASIAVHLQRNAGPLGVASVAAQAVSSLLEATARKPAEIFHGWQQLDLASIGEFTFATLRHAGLLSPLPTAEGTGDAFEARLHGQRLGWVVHQSGWVEGPRLAPGLDRASGIAAIRVALWSLLGSRLAYREPAARPATLTRDDVGSAEPSALADSLARTLAGGGTALLHGPPGAGKSCAARCVAELLGGLRLRVQARDLSSARHLADVVSILQPTLVLVDDLDRVSNDDGSVLDTIDSLRSAAKVLIVTANDATKLDPALLRPGRFDEIRAIDRLDDAAVQRVIDRLPESLRTDRVRALPIAYVAYLADRVQGCDAEALLSELEARAKLAARASCPAPVLKAVVP